MVKIQKKVEERLRKALERKKSVLLLGPRQTGKVTLVKYLNSDLYKNLVSPENRQTYEKSPDRLTND